jgi:phosphoribosylformylglycinamidine synthase
MQRYTIFVNILPHPELLDPQGKATLGGLQSLDFGGVQDVRVGKRIQLDVHAADPASARSQAEAAAKQLLVNPIVERFELEGPIAA